MDSSCLHGEYQELCELLGYETVEKIYRYYCGSYLNLPKKLFTDDFLHKHIAVCYSNGDTIKDIARECGYTYSWALKIIRKLKQEGMIK